MALLSTTITHPSLFFKIPNPNKPLSSSLSFTNPKIHFPRFLSPSLHVTHSSLSDPNPNPRISDEWGEPSEPEPEPEPESPPDPPMSEDEWGVDDSSASASASAPVTVSGCTKEEEEEEYVTIGNGSTPTTAKDKADVAGEGDRVNKLTELKRCLVDTFYGTELGFRAGPEVRAEVSELVAQLEAANPTPAPTDSTALLDGDWVLLYTAFSELLPLLAAGTTPLLKVKEIRQAIDTSSLTILNSTTLSSPFATFSFSASATFEVRSSTRIQVAFKEGTFQPPEIKTSIDLPENVDVFGQRINLLPVQQSLSPLQDAVASISRVISGQPPLKVPIPGDRTSSWLLITYLDDDFRISRGDGGLFVLAKVGSTLLDQ